MCLALWLIAAQAAGTREEGKLVVRLDTLVVARETYMVGTSRMTDGRTGWLLTSTTRYDRDRPLVVLSPTLELGSDSLPVTLQFDVAKPREPERVIGQQGRNRFTVRTAAKGLERAREFPMRPPAVILDDDVFALYEVVGWFARAEPLPITAIFARAGRREQLTLADSGTGPLASHQRQLTARHLTLAGGTNELVHVWLDERGRLVRVTIPSRKLVAEREPTD